MALALTIDLGTTNLKIGLVDETGKIVSLQSVLTPAFTDKSGNVMHDPGKLLNAVLMLSRQVLADADRSDVRFIIGSTYQFGLMFLDDKKKPITGMTLLTDIRSQTTFPEFVASVDGEDLYRRTGCPLISQYVLPRLFYFSRKEADIFRMAKYFHDSKSFLFSWLTGEWVTDISVAAATQLYNLDDFEWDAGLTAKVSLSAGQFPRPEDGTSFQAGLREEIRSELGLNKGIKVMLGVYDGAALGAGLTGFKPGVGMLNVGTTAMLRAPGHKPVFDKDKNKRIQAYPVKKDLFLNGGALNNAALPLDWMRNYLFDIRTDDPGLSDVSPEPPLMSLPYLTGERDSETGPYASGVFFGIRRKHRPVDFARSVLEGVAFSMKYMYDAFEENHFDIKEIGMGGGGAKIEAWPQMFADILGVPVSLSTVSQPALVGSAMIAFTAGGVFNSMREATDSMVEMMMVVDPREEQLKIRQCQYQFYKKLRETIGPLYQEHSRLRFDVKDIE